MLTDINMDAPPAATVADVSESALCKSKRRYSNSNTEAARPRPTTAIEEKAAIYCFTGVRVWEAVLVIRIRHGIAAAAMGSALGCTALGGASTAGAVPAPEVEYTYNVAVRRHFDFPGNDALGYGRALCDKVALGVPYADVMGDVKRDVLPNDEQSANYVVSYAVGILCPALIWQLRTSAAGYRQAP